MPCFKPLTAYQSLYKDPKTGKGRITFEPYVTGFREIQLPCGQCIGCRLEKSRQWAIRCLHEASLYDQNCFLTLTYDDAHLPDDNSLVKSHFQKFMKRLRKKYGNTRIRFFHCGEYGERFARPHYHACLFNFDFPDKLVWKDSRENKLYVSPTLNKIWGKGYCIIGDVTFESAAYVARYITKKINGKDSDEHYVNKETGVIREKEYITMSRRPGIGGSWYTKYSTDVFPHDMVIVNERKVRPPKYYDYLFELSGEDLQAIKELRKINGKKFDKNNTPDRLEAREKVAKSKLATLKRRKFEND